MKKRLPFLLATLAGAALAAQANDGLDLAMKSKAMAAASAQAVSAPAPHGKDPLPEILLRSENERLSAGPRCGEAVDLCYDLQDGRMVYRGGRRYMPQFEGLKAESVSLRHDGFVLRYSFK